MTGRFLDPIALAKALVRISSLSGSEEKISIFLGKLLSKHGFKVKYFYSDSRRPNLFASIGKPGILFCSHLDTVPPFIAVREDSRYLYGRGACDAKGVIAAQIAAGLRLRSQGVAVGFLYVVGEEVDHRGAIDVARKIPKVEVIIVGEPTENHLAVATKGIIKVKLISKGRAAHSAYPSRGESAIDPLIRILSRIQKLRLPKTRGMGSTTLNIGIIRGGTAANIIADESSAEILVRTVTRSDSIFTQLKKQCEKGVKIELQSINDPVKLDNIEGFKTSVVSFNTDIPYLKHKAKKIFLLGPGSILDAHGLGEKIPKSEILKAVFLYERLAKSVISD